MSLAFPRFQHNFVRIKSPYASMEKKKSQFHATLNYFPNFFKHPVYNILKASKFIIVFGIIIVWFQIVLLNIDRKFLQH